MGVSDLHVTMAAGFAGGIGLSGGGCGALGAAIWITGMNKIKAGVEKVSFVDGRVDHSVLLEIFTDRGVGTLLTMRPSRAAPRGKAASRAAGS